MASSGQGGALGTSLLFTTIGGMMVYSALKGQGITDVLAGKAGDTLDPHGAKPYVAPPISGDPTTTPTPTEAGPTGDVPRGYPLARQGNIIGTPYTGTHTLGNWQSDNAVDIAVPLGTAVLAAIDGIISKIVVHPNDNGRFAGTQVTLTGTHGSVWYTHLHDHSVHVGSHVRVGDVLGHSGSANGVEHLHFAAKPPASPYDYTGGAGTHPNEGKR